MGRFLHHLFEDAGEAWMPEDVALCHWSEMVQVAWFMMGHCHLGNFYLLREGHSEDYPLCGGPYSRVHFLKECVALADLRSQWLAPFAWGRSGLRGLCGVIASNSVASLWVFRISLRPRRF